MKLRVAKFGGSSLADASHYKTVRNIILADAGRKYIIPSAPGRRNPQDDKITDLLLQCYTLAEQKRPFDTLYHKIISRFDAIIKELQLDLCLNKEYLAIYDAINKTVDKDYVASRGEYLSGRILAEYLHFQFIAPERGICFDDEGIFLPEETNTKMQQILKKHDYAVIPGFYGRLPNGHIKTFSRGGSDVTGAIVARAVMADVYENWTDVSGVKMANPCYVKNPKTMGVITYRELRDLSYMGATVLHEDAIFPVRKEGIPIHIRNTNKPDEKGSMIVGYRKDTEQASLITGIAGKIGYTGIFIEKENIRTFPHLYCQLCAIFDEHCLPMAHILYGIDSITVLVSSALLGRNQEILMQDICDAFDPDTVYFEDGISLIAVVGSGITLYRESIMSRICEALKQGNINIKMIDVGGSELSIFLAVQEHSFTDAQQLLYNEFAN